MKEYIRTDRAGDIFYWFTDESITPLEGDIRIDDQNCYHDWLNVRAGYCLRGIPQYRYTDGRIVKKTDEEIAGWKPVSAPSPEEQIMDLKRTVNILMGVENYD